MTDLAAPDAELRHLEVIESDFNLEAMDPEAIAELVRSEGMPVCGPVIAWRDVGARAMVLTAMNRDYVFELPQDSLPLVTRLDPPSKPIKNGPYIMLPIERCEAEPDSTIFVGQSICLNGLCRVTKRLQPNRGYNTGPVQGLTILR